MKKKILKTIVLGCSLAVFGLNLYLFCSDNTHYYQSNQSVSKLKDEMQKVFDFNRDNLVSSNLSGKFISQTEFEVKPKISFVYIENSFGDSKVVYLKGKIMAFSPNTSEVILISKPNSTFYTLPMIFSVFIFLIFFEKDKSTQNDDEKLETENNLNAVLAFLFIASVISFSAGYWVQYNLIDTVVDTFHLVLK